MKLQASPIRKLAPLARAAEQRGTEVIYLNIGQPDLPTPPPQVLYSKSAAASKVTLYSVALDGSGNQQVAGLPADLEF